MEALTTARLTLEPLTLAHADAMFEVLRDPVLYRHLDSKAHASVEHTREVYARLIGRTSPDGSRRWLNWIVVPHGAGPAGFVQATVIDGETAWIAYLLASSAQHRGYASQAVMAMKAHLIERHGIVRFLATVERDHAASIAVLARCGLTLAADDEIARHAPGPTEWLYVG